jgi:5'(3')-deoxyribonucleotidase
MYSHFKKYPDSLLARIYGVYRVQMKNYDAVNLILMGNTLKFKNKDDIFRVYDLKGSRVARMVNTTNAKPTTTLKDLNFFKNYHILKEVNLTKYDA